MPTPLALRDYQNEAVAFLKDRPRAINALPPGGGKTSVVISSLAVRSPQPSPVLVLAPLSVVRHWETEIHRWSPYKAVVGVGTAKQRADALQAFKDHLGAWEQPVVYVTNYEAAKADKANLFGVSWEAVVADEGHRCLPANVQVLTDEGLLPIREIVEDGRASQVLSYDFKTQQTVWKRITHRWKNPAKPLVRVHYTDGSLTCTADHRLWTTNGFKQAQDLAPAEDFVFLLRKAVSTECEERPILFSRLLAQKADVDASQMSSMSEELSTSKSQYQVLLTDMRDALADGKYRDEGTPSTSAYQTARAENLRMVRGGVLSTPERDDEAILLGIVQFKTQTSDDSESYVRPEHARTVATNATEDEASTHHSRREWETSSRTTTLIGSSPRMADRSSSSDEKYPQSDGAFAEVIQDRHRRLNNDDSDRGRWELAQSHITEVTGREKRPGIISARVERVEILESRSSHGHLDGVTTDSFLYDIEVEDVHNYFADNVLVSNCKNRKSQLFKFVRQIALPSPIFIACTGTPILNRVDELWSLLHLCNPPEAPIWMADLSFRNLGDIEVGDEVMGWDWLHPTGKQRRRTLVPATVVELHRRVAPLVKVTMASGRELRCTPDHLWRQWNAGCVELWTKPRLQTRQGDPVQLAHVIDVTPAVENERLAGWVAGMYDGEGSGLMIGQSHHANPETNEALFQALKELDIPFTMTQNRKFVKRRILDGEEKEYHPTDVFCLTGGRQGYTDFINKIQPIKQTRLRDKILGRTLRTKGDAIIDIQEDGIDEVISMTTTTGNYVAWGYASKNCDPKRWKSYWNFVDAVCDTTATTFNGKLPYPVKVISGMRPGMDGVLRQQLRDVMIRRSLEEILPELPDIVETIYEVDLSTEERKVYDNMEKNFFADFPDSEKIIAPNDVAKIMRLRQLSTDWNVLGATDDKSTKVKRLYELLADIGDEQVVIFSSFATVIDPIAAHLNAGKITGSVKHNDRDDVIAAFTQGSLRYLCGTIGAMGEGINLQTARHVVFLDLPWVPALKEQAIARVHRYGQGADAVFVHVIAARKTIDSYIAKVLRDKEGVIDTLVGSSWHEVLSGSVHGA